MKVLFLTLALVVSMSFSIVGNRTLCSTVWADKWFALEADDYGKVYFVSYIRNHETAGHVRKAESTTMNCDDFGAWADRNGYSLVK